MLYRHSNTCMKPYLWEEAIRYATTIHNNLPHKIQGEWRVPQIEMFSSPIDLSYFQLFGTTCHVLIQKKTSKLEPRTQKAIFTGINHNSAGTYRYVAFGDCAIRITRNAYFPCHLPDPVSLDAPLPIEQADSPDNIENPEEWIKVHVPSEGETESKPTPTSVMSTRHKNPEPKSTADPPAQGELLRPPTPPAPTSMELTNHTVPGNSTVSQHVTHSSAPKSFKHVALDKHRKPHRVLWFQALSDIIGTGFTPIESVHYASLDAQTLPPDILSCFHASTTTRIDGTPCFDAWIAHNFSSITSLSVDDTDSPKWKNTITSQQKDEWIASLNSEMGQLKNQDVYEDFPRHLIPLGNQLLTSGIVCRIKRNTDSSELLLKSHVVVHGNHQIARLSYGDTFSNTPDLGLIRVVLAITAYANLDCHMVDVTGAYTHTPIDCKLYVKYPEGYGKGGPTVMKLKKALYSAHQSGRLWEEYRNAKILAIGYRPNKKDVLIFTRMRNSVFSIIVCYVDDFVVCCMAGHIEPIKQEIISLFDCKDLGKLQLFLGLVIKHDQANQTLTMTMQSYIKSIVKLAGLDDAIWATTPMSNTQPVLEPIMPPDYSYPYVMNLGWLFWVACTCRPDIAFATSLLARFSNCYSSLHITALKRVFKYLAATESIGITYDGHKPFYEVVYSNTDYASQHGRKSVSGSVVLMAGTAVAWSSKCQTSVSLSMMEAEFVALCNTAKEVMSIHQFLDDLGVAYESGIPSPILCDNQAAIESVHNPTHKTCAKHINIAFNFIHDEIHKGTISISYVPTNDNLTNMLTKPLNTIKHHRLGGSILSTHIVSGSKDCTIQVWDACNGTLTAHPFEGHAGAVYSVGYSPDGTCVSTRWDFHPTASTLSLALMTIRVWNPYSSNGALIVSGSVDQTIRVWSAHDGTLAAGPFEGHTNIVTSVGFSPDGSQIVSASYNESISIWNVSDSPLAIPPPKGHSSKINSAEFSPDGLLIATGSGDNTIRVWSAVDGSYVAGPFGGRTGDVSSIAFSPDSTRVASGSDDKTIRVWHARDGIPLAGPIEGHTGPIYSVAFSPDGSSIASGSYDKTICVWDSFNGRLVAGPFKGHTRRVHSVAFSPDGAYIASSSYDGTIRIWSSFNGNPIVNPITRHTPYAYSACFSHDGSRIVSGSAEYTISIWSVPSGQLIAGPFKGHIGYVNSVAFSPDSTLIVSGSEDRTIRLWNADGTFAAPPLKGHTSWVNTVSFSPNGSSILSCSEDRSIRVWDIRQKQRTCTALTDDWEIRDDGWVLNAHSQMLFWLPAELRNYFPRPNNRFTIGPQGAPSK
ncbi:Copia protein [Ceratobasidium theobromae]|uniref:Copia protein n=1 Tax=Ceratobasidium theobromae TaxID=1582974 RepID=A0A5N5QA71_9AGAM|nr:Copia protein [Ceratobasidium theobromae]